jgi:hypothetical protein
MFHPPRNYELVIPGFPWKTYTVPYGKVRLNVVSSNDDGWEHVSVSTPNRCPTWEEMCYVKDLFWDDTDCVVQYHPPKSDYVNCHKFCLHMWRPTQIQMPRPPAWMVGPKG